MTGWYGAATTELPPAAWSAEADVGAERRNQVPLSRSIAIVARADAPAPGTDGPLLTGGGLAQPKRRGRLPAWILVATRRPGTPPGLMKPPSRGAWRCKRGRGRSPPGRAEGPQRWQARRAETVLAATVGYRHAAAAAWVGSVRRHRALSQHWLRLRRSRTARDGSPISTQLPHARPGAARAVPGRGRLHRAPANRRREPGCGAIRHPTYAAQSCISTRRRSNRSLRR